MKRTRATFDEAEESEESDQGVSGSELRARLRAANARWNLRAGESVINIRDKDQLTRRTGLFPREDGTVMEVTERMDANGNSHYVTKRTAVEEDDYGPTHAEEDFRRQDIVNRDPWVKFARLLAGATGRSVEQMYDERSLHNQRIYEEEMREWNKIERERLMVGSAEKKLQLDIVEAKRESLKLEQATLTWSHEFLERFATDMTFLVHPLADKRSSLAASLSLCYFIREQYDVAREFMEAVPSYAGEIRADLRPRFEECFGAIFQSPQGMHIHMKHKLADTFVRRASALFRDPANLGAVQFQHLALLLYKYLYTRDAYISEYLTIGTGSFDNGLSVNGATKQTSMRVIVSETAKELFLLYRKTHAMQLYFMAFRGEHSHDPLWDDQTPVTDFIGVDDIDYYRQKKELDDKLEKVRTQLIKLHNQESQKAAALKTEMEIILKQFLAIKTKRSVRFKSLLDAVRSPVSLDYFNSLFDKADARSNPFENDATLSILYRVLHIPVYADVRDLFAITRPKYGSRNFVKNNEGLDVDAKRKFMENEHLYLVVANLARGIRTGDAYVGENRLEWPSSMTDEAKRFFLALLLVEPMVKFTGSNSDREPSILSLSGEELAAIIDSGRIGDIFTEGMKTARTLSFHFLQKQQPESWDDKFLTNYINWRKVSTKSGNVKEDAVKRKIAEIIEEVGEQLEERIFNAETELDMYNVTLLSQGYTTDWKVPATTFTTLTYLKTTMATLDKTLALFHQPLLSGCMGTLTLFAQNEKVLTLFQPGSLQAPREELTRFLLLSKDARATATLADATAFLNALDNLAPSIRLVKIDDDVDAFVNSLINAPSLKLYSLKRHASLKIVLYVIAWARIVVPTEKATLASELDTVNKVIGDAQAELYRLAMGEEVSSKSQRNKVRDLYAPSVQWQMRPEFTGRVTLVPEVVLAMDRALALIHKFVPSLHDATLDALVECDMESGLPGAFVEFVAALMNNTQLIWPQTYNKDIQYKIAPRLCQNAINALQGYTVRALPGGGYEARRPGSRSSHSPSSPSPTLSVFFM